MGESSEILGEGIHEGDSRVRRGFLSGAIVSALLLVVGYVVLVNTRWGQTVDNAAYFGRRIVVPAVIEYDDFILHSVSVLSVGFALAFILIVGALRRCWVASAIVAAGFGCAVVGAEILKRTLPWHALVSNDIQLPLDLQRPTYPSGHTTIGTSLAIALILVGPVRWRVWIAVFAGIVSASFATGVLFAGWHRPSDVLGGIFWSASCMSLAALSAVALRGKTVTGGQRAFGPLVVSLLFVVANEHSCFVVCRC